MNWLQQLRQRPLLALTIIALIPRVLAAIFSQGYFAHDDHFLVIEAAGSWVDGFDYNNWLPWNQQGTPTPSGHSFFYVGLHYVLMLALKTIGISDPKTVMIVIRLLHAVWSLVVVRAGYRIALLLSNEKVAWNTGLFLALLYFMPFLSVRNLVEVACIPFLMLGALALLRSEPSNGKKWVLLAGIWIGLAINIRFQVLAFAAGPGLVLLLQRKWSSAVFYSVGLVIPFVILQGAADLYVWGRPFAEFGEYVGYNLEHTTTYFDMPWYQYVLVLLGIFIPPFSLLIIAGFAKNARRTLLISAAVLAFILVHSLIPNKQERFILPIVPLLFVIGYTGLEQWRSSGFPNWLQRSWRGVLSFTWALNIVLLCVLTFTYSKRSRVEAISALKDEKGIRGIVVEDSYFNDAKLMPQFYLNDWRPGRWHYDGASNFKSRIANADPQAYPNIVLFLGEEDLAQRWTEMEQMLGTPLNEIGRERPGFVDRIVHWLNPVNRNETIVIARTGEE